MGVASPARDSVDVSVCDKAVSQATTTEGERTHIFTENETSGDCRELRDVRRSGRGKSHHNDPRSGCRVEMEESDMSVPHEVDVGQSFCVRERTSRIQQLRLHQSHVSDCH